MSVKSRELFIVATKLARRVPATTHVPKVNEFIISSAEDKWLVARAANEVQAVTCGFRNVPTRSSAVSIEA
jgi:hypothetical protein